MFKKNTNGGGDLNWNTMSRDGCRYWNLKLKEMVTLKIKGNDAKGCKKVLIFSGRLTAPQKAKKSTEKKAYYIL